MTLDYVTPNTPTTFSGGKAKLKIHTHTHRERERSFHQWIDEVYFLIALWIVYLLVGLFCFCFDVKISQDNLYSEGNRETNYYAQSSSFLVLWVKKKWLKKKNRLTVFFITQQELISASQVTDEMYKAAIRTTKWMLYANFMKKQTPQTTRFQFLVLFFVSLIDNHI